jgi:C4-dicarboxylate transporter
LITILLQTLAIPLAKTAAIIAGPAETVMGRTRTASVFITPKSDVAVSVSEFVALNMREKIIIVPHITSAAILPHRVFAVQTSIGEADSIA